MPMTALSFDTKPWLIALALCVVGASSHLLPHPAGMSTVRSPSTKTWTPR